MHRHTVVASLLFDTLLTIELAGLDLLTASAVALVQYSTVLQQAAAGVLMVE